MSLLARDRPTTFCCNSAFTVASSSLTDCSSSFEVSSSSFVDCSSSFDGLQLLVRGPELLVGGLQLLGGRLEVFLLGPQLLLEGRDARVDVRAGIPRPLARSPGGRPLEASSLRPGLLLEHDQVQPVLRVVVRTDRQRPDRQADDRDVAVGLDPQSRVVHRLAAHRRLAQGRGQITPQPFAGHLQDVQAGFTRGRFQVLAGAAVKVEDVAVLVDEHAARGVLLEKGPLGQLARLQPALAARPRGGPGRPAVRRRRQEPRGGRAPCARPVIPALIQLRLPVQHREEVRELAHALGSAQAQQAARVQRIVEEGEELPLQVRAHVDEQVAAADQVEPGERGIRDHVLLGEDQRVADALLDAVGGAFRFLGEEAGQAFRRDVGGDAGRVRAGAGLLDGLAVDVGAEGLHPETVPQRLHLLLEQDGDGVGLLAGGAAGHPDADDRTVGPCPRRAAECRALWRAAHASGSRKKLVTPIRRSRKRASASAGVSLQIAHVLVQPLDLMNGHAPLHPSDDRALLVLREVVPVCARSRTKIFFRASSALVVEAETGRGARAEGVGDVGDQLGRHLGRRQHVVHQTGGDGAARHAVVLGGFRVLRHRHAALALDRAQPQGAVAAGAREHDADGPFVLVLGQRAEEEVDRQALAAWRGGLEELQLPVQEGHVAVGRDDVGAVGLHRHPVRDLEHLHAGVALDQVGEDALVVGGQVLHQHERHAALGVGGHAGEEGLEGREPSGRCANADDGKGRLGTDDPARLRRALDRRQRRHGRRKGLGLRPRLCPSSHLESPGPARARLEPEHYAPPGAAVKSSRARGARGLAWGTSLLDGRRDGTLPSPHPGPRGRARSRSRLSP